MKTLLIIFVMTSTLTADDDFPLRMSRPRSMDEVDPWLRGKQRHRLQKRRTYALEIRRQINSQRPPARGWTAIRVPVDPFGPIAIQRGWIIQPPIYVPRRWWYIDPVVPSYSE